MGIKKLRLLIEKYFTTVEPYEEPVDIFMNPSTLELGKVWSEDKIVRGWTDSSGNVYVWNGDSASHSDIVDELSSEEELRIFIEPDKVLGIYSEYDEYDEDREKEIIESINNNNNMKPVLRFTNNEINVVFGEYDAGEDW